MTCLCPKCSAPIELDHSGIQNEGLKTDCPACSARLQIIRETFARRAYGSTSGKSCASCGGQLGAGLVCSDCGALYPEFFVAADPAVIRQQARELKRQRLIGAFKNIEISLPSIKGGRTVQSVPGYDVRTVVKGSDYSTQAKTRSLISLIAGIVIVAAVLGGGYSIYATNKAEQLYVGTYFKALYGIKTGADLSAKVTGRIAADWKSAQDAGRSFSSFPSTEELNRLNKVKSEVDKMFAQQLAEPPKKLAASREGLMKLNEQYTRLHALATSPPKSLAELNDASGKASASFEQSAKSLKSTLPEEMSTELVNAKKKYKVLKDF